MKKAQWASNALSEDRDMFGTVAVIVLVVGLVAAIAFYFDKKRREMWESVARRYGFTYERRDPYDIPSRYQSFALFQRGHSRKASNCLEGRYQDTHVLLFDYRYTTGGGKNQTTHACPDISDRRRARVRRRARRDIPISKQARTSSSCRAN
jgi:hypothetical protein